MSRYLERRAHWRQAAPHPGTPPFRRQTYALTTKHNKKKKDILRCPFLCFCPPYRLTHCPRTSPPRPCAGTYHVSPPHPHRPLSRRRGRTPRPGFPAQSSNGFPPACTAGPPHQSASRTRYAGGLDDFKKILHSLVGEIYNRRIYLCCKCEIIYFCMKPKVGTINKIAAKW